MSADAFQRLGDLEPGSWLALDTETTGTGPHDQVVEIAIVQSDGDVVVNTLVRPDRPIPKTATQIHGIHQKTVEDAPTWPEVWPRLRGHLLGSTMLAWNAAFDVRLMRQSCARHRLPFRLAGFLCLREAFRWRFPVGRATLPAACLALGIESRPAHRALPDAEVAREIALRLTTADPLLHRLEAP